MSTILSRISGNKDYTPVPKGKKTATDDQSTAALKRVAIQAFRKATRTGNKKDPNELTPFVTGKTVASYGSNI